MKTWVQTTLVCAACNSHQEPRFQSAKRLAGIEVSAEVLNRGADVYAMRCASCHGADGSGNGRAASGLRFPPRDFRTADFRYKSTPGVGLPTDEDLKAVIRRGQTDRGMPSWSGMNEDDLVAVVQFIKTFSSRWEEPSQ